MSLNIDMSISGLEFVTAETFQSETAGFVPTYIASWTAMAHKQFQI